MTMTILDVKGLACPLPVLRAKKALKTIPVQGILRVLATDAGALKDIPAFCTQTGHELVATAIEDHDTYVFDIRRTD